MGVAAAEAEPAHMPEADLWPYAKAVYLYTSIQMSTIVRQTGQMAPGGKCSMHSTHKHIWPQAQWRESLVVRCKRHKDFAPLC